MQSRWTSVNTFPVPVPAVGQEVEKASPMSALLVDKVTDLLLASDVTQIESCATQETFMAQLWTGRRTSVDLLIDVDAADALRFRLAHFGARGYASARDWRHWLRGKALLPARRKNLAVTRG